MNKENTGDDYESMRSIEQDLSFTTLQQEFINAKLSLDKSNQRTLALIAADGLYTNLALILSEQCPFTLKLAIFEGNNKTIFKDRYEFTGSLFKQLNDIYNTINRYNRTAAIVEGLKRKDIREYPELAIREVLLNLLVHRDYAYSASSLISIYDDRMEFLSIGGLFKGISQSDIMLGVSITRNKALADIFYRLRYIEAYGTGIGKIFEAYADCALKPNIEISDNAFKVTLPNMRITKPAEEVQMLSDKEKQILSILKSKDYVKRKEIEDLLSISQSLAVQVLKKLLNKKLIIKCGQGKNIYYKLAN